MTTTDIGNEIKSKYSPSVIHGTVAYASHILNKKDYVLDGDISLYFHEKGILVYTNVDSIVIPYTDIVSFDWTSSPFHLCINYKESSDEHENLLHVDLEPNDDSFCFYSADDLKNFMRTYLVASGKHTAEDVDKQYNAEMNEQEGRQAVSELKQNASSCVEKLIYIILILGGFLFFAMLL